MSLEGEFYPGQLVSFADDPEGGTYEVIESSGEFSMTLITDWEGEEWTWFDSEDLIEAD